MAVCGVSSVAVSIAGVARDMYSNRRERASIEMHGGLGVPPTCGPKHSPSARLVWAVRGGREEGRVFATQGLGSKEDVGILYPNIASATLRELETFQSRRWSEVTTEKRAALDDGGASEREEFENGGGITELGMERLVDSLLKEDGQSAEDYQFRAKFFALIAEFFRQGKAYSAETDESVHAARRMQNLVDSILANDGRSAADYNVRAQFFAKSAEVFPFNAEVRRL